ncbi:outer membrane protein transport protein [Pelagicoccus sp. SDUM812002]|uniref:OmpP1/FadL family transporter n=1 Tax=Pelagicoccus sp. SDUM812002 TaxID=3041266 RepID=UPI00280F64EA|nr:outer membrane protein transport protein [Pelagicoccus sp. SDUM812002]MDQ8187832.1 outer membrane protein transport protein [Pelagicoccus sp. SDUM812002]
MKCSSQNLGITAFASISLFASNLFAAGFAIQEQSISGLGNAYAGGAASAEDASTVYFNPAGMSLIEKPQLHAGIHFIMPEAEFTNLGSTTLTAPTQGSDAISEEEALVPNLYYVAPMNDDLVWGIGISAPFGLTTDFEDDWVGRYVARRTELKTVLVNPSLAFRVNDKLSIGGGLDYVKADAVLSNAIDMGLVFLNQFQLGGIPVNAQSSALAGDIQANMGGPKYDGGLRLEGDGDGWGFNVGALYEMNEDWRLGVHYRSKVELGLSGQADFTVGALESVLGDAFADQGGGVDINLPDTLSISVFGNVTEKLSLMADVTNTSWSEFQELRIEFENPSPPANVIPELWQDVSKYSLGASYKFNDRLMGRFGLAYDESPVPNDEVRSPRIPDEDRKWISLGLSVAATKQLDLHFAYLSIIVDDPMIDNTSHSAGQRLYGKIDASVSLLSMGLSRRF